MNERIRELAEKAYRLTVLASQSELHKCIIGSDYFNALEKEKFAELIVRESMEVTKTYTSNQGLDYSAPVALARHFGVQG